MAKTKRTPVDYDQGKFGAFEAMIAQSDVNMVLIAWLEVLGDTCEELVINLGGIALSGKPLAIAGPSPFIEARSEGNPDA